MVTRSRSGALKAKIAYAGLTEEVTMSEPTNPNESFKVAHWKKAMIEKYEVLVKNNTWELVPYRGQQLTDCKWIFRTKLTVGGSVERHKVRLGAKEFQKIWA